MQINQLQKSPWTFIIFGIVCYLISFGIFGSNGSSISTTLNALGFISIIGGIVILFRKLKSRKNQPEEK